MTQMSRRNLFAAASSLAASQVIPTLMPAARAQSTNAWRNAMTTTIAVDANIITLINVLTVDPANQPKLLSLLRNNTENTISTLKGWISTTLVASKDLRRVIIYSQWMSVADVDAMRKDPRMVAYFPTLTALATFDSIVGDVVEAHHA
jgi:quinol monooxygenase YgiN